MTTRKMAQDKSLKKVFLSSKMTSNGENNEKDNIKFMATKTSEKDLNGIYYLDDDTSIKKKKLQTKIIIQNNIMKEYELWINNLLNIVNEKSKSNQHVDVGTPIQQGLQRIEDLIKENYDIKTLTLEKIKENEEKKRVLEQNKKVQVLMTQEFNTSINEKFLQKEKDQLINNIQMLANELDELGETNKQLQDKIENNKLLSEVNKLYKEKKELYEESVLGKKVLELRDRKNCLHYSDNYINTNKNILTNLSGSKKLNTLNSKSFENYDTVGITRGLGDYKLENEESEIGSDGFGFFHCGF